MLNLSRRSFLSVGGLGLLSMPQILMAQKQNGTSHKAVINIFLGGGPPHQDMWDIKATAPSNVKGEFNPISTNVAGIQIGECFPKIAAMFDKFTAIRTIVGSDGGHDGYQCMTGWSRKDMVGGVSYPSIGSCASKILGPRRCLCSCNYRTSRDHWTYSLVRVWRSWVSRRFSQTL